MSNVDINVDRRTDGLTDGRMDGRTENRTPISHPATSRCDNKKYFKMLSAAIVIGALTHGSLETPKKVTGKQCRPRSDAAERGI